jgi:hypothetical protein
MSRTALRELYLLRMGQNLAYTCRQPLMARSKLQRETNSYITPSETRLSPVYMRMRAGLRVIVYAPWNSAKDGTIC